MSIGTLSIVATPIGNLEDITLRALRTLREADAIFAEDTRVIAKLLAKYEIQKPVHRLDTIKETRRIDEIVERLSEGERLVFVSDAGTPGISDPGGRLVAGVREKLPEAKIEAIPGPSSLTAALSIAGLDSPSFTFVGFLPHKKGRHTALTKIQESEVPVILFESPHRIVRLLDELGEKKVIVARELTKIYEEVLTGSAQEVCAQLQAHPEKQRGEFVVIVHHNPHAETDPDS